tara:strand:+ start:5502 stop:5702 length:201 start_codon:yes stop_codon:yes gene_type:complete
MIQITLQQAQQLCQIIDMASTRGAFRANELEAVGTLHNTLATEIQKQQPAPNPKANKKVEKEDVST